MVIDAVISVSSRKDIEVWRKAAPEILRHINAKDYLLIVPDHEIEDFKAATPSAYRVMPESSYVGNTKEKLQTKMQHRRPSRIGWYLQQIIKIAACQQHGGEYLLIWDADTVPMRDLEFFSSEGCPIYYRSDENHAPYFVAVNKLLGLEKSVDFSFIAQSFPLRASWLAHCLSDMETRAALPWIEAIIAAVDLEEASSFSEYETLGAYFAHRFRPLMQTRHAQWLRFGHGAFGNIQTIDAQQLKEDAADFDYVSFESWDRKPRRALKLSIQLARHPLFGRFFAPKPATVTSL